jgi:uncharacterized protein YkwD
MIRKIIQQLLVFIFLIVFALALLFMAEAYFSHPVIVTEPGLRSADANQERIDFSAHSYTVDKELSFDPGEKTRPEPKPLPPAASSGIGGAVGKEQQMVQLINKARINAGLPPLQVSSQLTAAARAKSKDMIDHNYFSHSSPTFGDYINLIKIYGVSSYRAAAENLAMNSNGSVAGAHSMLMASPDHRDNILSGSYSLVGVGIQVRSDGSHFYTQLFVGY